MPARKPKGDDKQQFERFIETAKRIGASDTDEILEQTIKRVAQPKRPKLPVKKDDAND